MAYLCQDTNSLTSDLFQTDSLEIISQTIVLADFTLNMIVIDVLKQGNYQLINSSIISNYPVIYISVSVIKFQFLSLFNCWSLIIYQV